MTDRPKPISVLPRDPFAASSDPTRADTIAGVNRRINALSDVVESDAKIRYELGAEFRQLRDALIGKDGKGGAFADLKREVMAQKRSTAPLWALFAVGVAIAARLWGVG